MALEVFQLMQSANIGVTLGAFLGEQIRLSMAGKQQTERILD